MGLPALRIPSAAVLPSRPGPVQRDVRATIRSAQGDLLSSVVADLSCSPIGWSMTAHGAERPGALTRHYFAAGARDVVVELPDGRSGAAVITGTSFSDGKRLYRIEGKGVLAAPLAFLRQAS